MKEWTRLAMVARSDWHKTGEHGGIRWGMSGRRTTATRKGRGALQLKI